jgi:hypothetical protein
METTHLTPQELVQYLKGTVTKKTLANWRWKRKGPPFTRSGRSVLYAPDDVERWLEARRRNAEPKGV